MNNKTIIILAVIAIIFLVIICKHINKHNHHHHHHAHKNINTLIPKNKQEQLKPIVDIKIAEPEFKHHKYMNHQVAMSDITMVNPRHMANSVSTCPCGKNIPGGCKCKKNCDYSGITGECIGNNKNTDYNTSVHTCPTDRTYNIIPPLLVEPRMITTNNGMRCDARIESSVNGVPSMDLSKYDGSINQEYELISDEFPITSSSNYLSAEITNGLPPLYQPSEACLAGLINDPKKCFNL